MNHFSIFNTFSDDEYMDKNGKVDIDNDNVFNTINLKDLDDNIIQEIFFKEIGSTDFSSNGLLDSGSLKYEEDYNQQAENEKKSSESEGKSFEFFIKQSNLPDNEEQSHFPSELPFVNQITQTILSKVEENYDKQEEIKSIDNPMTETLLDLENFQDEKGMTTSGKSVSQINFSGELNMFDNFYESEPENFIQKGQNSIRKLADDSIRKKAKVKIEDSIIWILNKHYRVIFPFLEFSFRKLPQIFLKNVSIPMNKSALNMTIEGRLSYDFGDKLKKKLSINRENLLKINYLLEKEKIVEPEPLLKMKVKDLIKKYLASSRYQRDLLKIEGKEGSEYAKRFDSIVRGDQNTLGYVEYFLKTSPNIKRNKKI